MQWGQDTTTFNYFWTTTTAGIRKPRQQGGCRQAEALVCVPSCREGRQAPRCHQLSAPTSSEAALLLQQAHCPKAQPTVSLLQSGMNNKANLETRNQAGARGNLCRLPQQLHKSMSPETTTLRTLWQQSPLAPGWQPATQFSGNRTASLSKISPAQSYEWKISKGHQNSWHDQCRLSIQQSQAGKVLQGRSLSCHCDWFSKFFHLRE